eukprot:1159506-Pelagomonas_calceolata.AAC.7
MNGGPALGLTKVMRRTRPDQGSTTGSVFSIQHSMPPLSSSAKEWAFIVQHSMLLLSCST